MNIIEQIKKRAEDSFENSRWSHDWEHTMRVYHLCVHIGQKENADMEVLELAAILHDIWRKYQDDSKWFVCHAEKWWEIAKEILAKFFISQDKIDQIVHCIISHRKRWTNIPVSLEAKILFDSDKLDSIWAVGIGRAFLFAWEIGAKLHNKWVDITKTKPYTREDTAYREFLVWLNAIKDKMYTNEWKRIAKWRHDFMVKFFDRINAEVDGEL